MKVLHVIPSLSSLRGGPTFVVKTLASHQARAGVEVHVAATDDDGCARQSVPLGKPLSSDGVTYWYFGRSTRTYTSSLGLTSWLLRHTAEFDIVHIHSVFSFPATVSTAIARLKSVPYVVRPLGVLNRWGLGSGRAWAKRFSIRWIESGILRRAAAVQFSSAKERAETAEVCALGKTAVIANPVELDATVQRGLFRAAHPSIGGRRIVLFLARLDPVKGIELLLDAFRIVRAANPQVVLAIAGSGAPGYRLALGARAVQLGIAADVIWTGFLDRTAKTQALADADVFVVPSQSESFGLAAVEALAAGVPTVMTDGVGIADEVASNGAGLVVPADSRALADAIERVLSEPELAARLSHRGVSLVRSRYQSDAVAAQVMQLYTEIGGRV